MTHLSEVELVDLVEGTLPAERRSHAATCERCQARAADAAQAIAAASEVDVPEPSPLFWQHLQGRVMDGIASPDQAAGRSLWLRPATWAFAAAAVAVFAVLAGLRTFDSSQPIAPDAPTPSEIVDAGSDLPGAADDDLNVDEAWAVVRTVADDVNWGAGDAAEAGIALRPGSANSAALALSPAELTELARLLENELARGKGA